MGNPLEALTAILRLAYSGELAAALAYRGHWKSVGDPDERARIRQIEEEEWHHRDLVGGMLARIGMDLAARLPMWPAPPPKNEIRASFEREMPDHAPAKYVAG